MEVSYFVMYVNGLYNYIEVCYFIITWAIEVSDFIITSADSRRQLSVSGKRMCTILVNRLED